MAATSWKRLLEKLEASFEELAMKFPSAHYFDFCYRLGVCYDESQAILKENKQDYRESVKEVLWWWSFNLKAEGLKKALKDADIGGFGLPIVASHCDGETSHGGNAVVSSKRIVPAQKATVTPHPTQGAPPPAVPGPSVPPGPSPQAPNQGPPSVPPIPQTSQGPTSPVPNLPPTSFQRKSWGGAGPSGSTLNYRQGPGNPGVSGQNQFHSYQMPKDAAIEPPLSNQPDAATLKLPRYNMSRLPRGLCIIFNAEEFPNQPDLETRTGTEKDVEKLYNTFLDRLLFRVSVQKNPTSSDFISCLQKIQQMDHSEFDCFACVILTHGCLGKVYGTDGKTVAIDALTSLFRGEYCPSLVNKPKLFFIQACQGKETQSPVDIRQDAPPTIPNQADILVSLSTVPGFASNRSISQGTWYISSLCEVLTRYYKTVDLLSMLTMVNDMLSSGVDKQFMKQIGHPSHTLRKQIFFNQGLSD